MRTNVKVSCIQDARASKGNKSLVYMPTKKTYSCICTNKDNPNGRSFMGGPRPKIFVDIIVVEGKQSYQIFFTGSKNIDPSRIYRIFKIAKHMIQLPCGRVLYSRLSQKF